MGAFPPISKQTAQWYVCDIRLQRICWYVNSVKTIVAQPSQMVRCVGDQFPVIVLAGILFHELAREDVRTRHEMTTSYLRIIRNTGTWEHGYCIIPLHTRDAY